MEADISSQAVGLASNTDFSIISLFIRADIIVKSVMIMLVASSVYSWAIIFDKIRMFKKINKSEKLPAILEINIEKQMTTVDKNFTFLASVGSTAPFIGLFGTVWGIMNSFQSIAISRNTSLAIVAPGIAEALFATALGLLAAIPAVVAYNKFSNDSKKYSQKLENFSKRFLTII
jgi:biopolymer transport protein TolQ